MNRIVLIGNGFDLAHGLQTSYKHFICWYWKQWGYRLLNGLSKEESDGLCSFTINEGLNVPNWTSAFQGWYFRRENPLIPWDETDAFSEAIKDRELCEFTFISPLLQRIWKRFLLGWVDIENEYFSLLREEKMSMDKGIVYPNYKELNDHLDILRNSLIQYLTAESEKGVPEIDEIKEKIYHPIKEREISVAFKRLLDKSTLGNIVPNAVMFLNFNYTKTPELYVATSSKVQVNYIHGRLDDSESVIFGYGDELDDSFKKLQSMNDNECFAILSLYATLNQITIERCWNSSNLMHSKLLLWGTHVVTLTVHY